MSVYVNLNLYQQGTGGLNWHINTVIMILLGYINNNAITDNSKQKKIKTYKNKENVIKSHERQIKFKQSHNSIAVKI